MDNPEFHHCECGYKWRHGKSGAHHCSKYYMNRIMKLATEVNNQAATIRAAEEQAAQDMIELAESDIVLMPRALTAENGAKGLLMGEFEEVIESTCMECFGIRKNDCKYCQGTKITRIIFPISWTTIKEIYAKCVENLEVKP